MRRYSPQYHSPPRRGYGGRERDFPRRGYGGGGSGYGRREQSHGSLLVRNIPLDCRPEELRIPFERFGLVRDVYIPKDYYTGQPRGFAFVQFVDSYDASEAQRRMNGKIFAGREISVVVAAETRKRPEEMRHKSRARIYLACNSPEDHQAMGDDHLIMGVLGLVHHPVCVLLTILRVLEAATVRGRRHEEQPRSPVGPPQERDGDYSHRSYSPGYENADGNGYGEKSAIEPENSRAAWRRSPCRSSRSPGRYSRSPSGSRSRSADLHVGIADK
ncbi:hypothetical protein GOBAR_DD30987 [Gossypium barbadense]|nr:hypothetical protein GOBAR_DD30987 [Gossypium barbadense]